ncbi:MAG TPA: PPC domain-containing protein, partial [Planctomycetaceae bacterium]|nr:PPC domain-containing protein [Planctomycetaceae bacterium]
RITVPAEAAVGVHGLRVVTQAGVSALRLFVVDDLPSVAAKTDNKSRDAAQELALSVAVDGYVDGLSYHYFKFRAEAGQRIAFDVLARRIGSPLDPIIRLLDSAGRDLAYSDDEPGLMSDAQLCHTFKDAGEYFIEIRDIQYRGSANHVYRLRIGDFPCVTVPYPLAAKRGSEVTLTFAGADAEQIEPVTVRVPEDPDLTAVTVGARRAGGNASGLVSLLVSDTAEFVETEPNNAAEQANRVELGASLNGRFDQPGDVDRYVFAAKKGQALTFTSTSRQLGSPVYLKLRLLKADGGQVAAVDDPATTEPVLTSTIPEDGDYTLLVEELVGFGGSRYVYRIETSAGTPRFTLSASADALNVPANGTLQVDVTAARAGYNGPIAVAATNLPAGITSTPTVIGAGQTKVGLTLTAAADVEAGKLSEVAIVGTAPIGGSEFRATASVADAIKAANNAIPWAPAALARSAALAAAPKPPFGLRTEPQQIVFGRNLKASVKVIAERGEGIDEEIALALPDPKATGLNLPGNVTAALKPVPKGQNEVEIEFTATDKAPLGEFTANFVATHKKGDATVTQPVPGVGLKLDEPFRLTLEVGEGKLTKGGELKVKVVAARNPAFAAPISVTVDNLPKGVTAEPVTIAADAAEAEITLKAAADAEAGSTDKLAAKGEGQIGEAKFAGTSATVALTVE